MNHIIYIVVCQECRRAVFWAHYCSPVHLRAVFNSGEKVDRFCRRFNFDGCCATLGV